MHSQGEVHCCEYCTCEFVAMKKTRASNPEVPRKRSSTYKEHLYKGSIATASERTIRWQKAAKKRKEAVELAPAVERRLTSSLQPGGKEDAQTSFEDDTSNPAHCHTEEGEGEGDTTPGSEVHLTHSDQDDHDSLSSDNESDSFHVVSRQDEESSDVSMPASPGTESDDYVYTEEPSSQYQEKIFPTDNDSLMADCTHGNQDDDSDKGSEHSSSNEDGAELQSIHSDHGESENSGSDEDRSESHSVLSNPDEDWTFMMAAEGTNLAADISPEPNSLSNSNSDSEDSFDPNEDFYEKITSGIYANEIDYDGDNANGEDHDPARGVAVPDLIQTLLILASKMRHNLSYKATEDIVKLAGVLSKAKIPQATKYFWKKIVNKFAKGMSIHHTCPKCFNYIGIAKCIGDNDFEPIVCSCGEEIDPKLNVKSGNVFIYVSLRQQLKNILEACGQTCDYGQSRTKCNAYAFEDIFDGDVYKSSVGEGMMSVNFSVDGVPVFKSSLFSLCPLVCTLNDLEPKKRSEYLMLCGLWFGEGKPKNMNAYLAPFVAESRYLYNTGLNFVVNGIEQTRYVKVLVGISDTPQRAVLRCSTQFNGYYGCGLCLHPGIEVPKGKGTVHVYPLKDSRGIVYPADVRTHADTLRHTLTREFGIKERTILFDIPHFDVIKCLDLDWPHAVLFGVARQFATLMFEPEYKDKDFTMYYERQKVDKFLLSIKPSSEVSRTPRKMSDRKHWKMHEWAIWLLFYSVPTLDLYMKHRRYVHHWALLVEAISILTKRSIMRSEVDYAERCLLSFIDDIPQLYGIERVSFNVHLLSHLPQSVKNFSCLWTHSSFIYEDCYQDLLSFVKSTQGVPIQICDSFRMRWVVKQLLHICKNELNEEENDFLENLLSRKLRSTPSEKVEGASLIGAGTPSLLQHFEYTALQRLRVNIPLRNVSVYHFQRAFINGEVVQAESYGRVSKRNNHVTLLKDGNVFNIKTFVVFQNENNSRVCYALGHYFCKKRQPLIRGRKLDHLILVDNKQETQMAAVSVKDVVEKLTFFSVPTKTYSIACLHPNHIELLV